MSQHTNLKEQALYLHVTSEIYETTQKVKHCIKKKFTEEIFQNFNKIPTGRHHWEAFPRYSSKS